MKKSHFLQDNQTLKKLSVSSVKMLPLSQRSFTFKEKNYNAQAEQTLHKNKDENTEKKTFDQCPLITNGMWAHIPSEWLPMMSSILGLISKAIQKNDIQIIYELQRSKKELFSKLVNPLSEIIDDRSSVTPGKLHTPEHFLKEMISLRRDNVKDEKSYLFRQNSAQLDEWFIPKISNDLGRTDNLSTEENPYESLLECVCSLPTHLKRCMKEIKTDTISEDLNLMIDDDDVSNSLSMNFLLNEGNARDREERFKKLLESEFEFYADKEIGRVSLDDYDSSDYEEFNIKYVEHTEKQIEAAESFLTQQSQLSTSRSLSEGIEGSKSPFIFENVSFMDDLDSEKMTAITIRADHKMNAGGRLLSNKKSLRPVNTSVSHSKAGDGKPKTILKGQLQETIKLNQLKDRINEYLNVESLPKKSVKNFSPEKMVSQTLLTSSHRARIRSPRINFSRLAPEGDRITSTFYDKEKTDSLETTKRRLSKGKVNELMKQLRQANKQRLEEDILEIDEGREPKNGFSIKEGLTEINSVSKPMWLSISRSNPNSKEMKHLFTNYRGRCKKKLMKIKYQINEKKTDNKESFKDLIDRKRVIDMRKKRFRHLYHPKIVKAVADKIIRRRLRSRFDNVDIVGNISYEHLFRYSKRNFFFYF